jgi:DNA-binding response OmpR family regulator
MAKILVVDDEPTLRNVLHYNLTKEAHQVRTAGDGEEAIDQAREYEPDLILLDVMLPKLDGFEVCKAIRRESNVPILMLTAKNSEIDKVVGLEIGADDYITKPFSMRELVARVKAMIRRSEMLKGELITGEADKTRLAVRGLTMDLLQHKVMLDGRTINMKPKEFELLAFLLRHPDQVFSRDQLLDQVWGYEFGGDTRTVDVHIRWLREKIEEEPSKPTYLETVRGVGYRLVG